jgi:hypothetical protein
MASPDGDVFQEMVEQKRMSETGQGFEILSGCTDVVNAKYREIVIPVYKMLAGSSIEEKRCIQLQFGPVPQGEMPAQGVLEHLVPEAAYQLDHNHGMIS